MNQREINSAKKLLDDHVQRVETCGADCTGGLCLTAYWNGGGQRLFYTMEQVLNWLEDYAMRNTA